MLDLNFFIFFQSHWFLFFVVVMLLLLASVFGLTVHSLETSGQVVHLFMSAGVLQE